MRNHVLKSKIKNFTKQSAKLKAIINSGQDASTFEISRSILKVKHLLRDLKRYLSFAQLRRALGAAALLVGLTFANNANGQNFLDKKENPFGLDTGSVVSMPSFVDLDGDGDFDVLMGEMQMESTYGYMGNGGWKYFENVGTANKPEFAAPKTNPFNLDTIGVLLKPAFADFDDDGDYDLLAGNSYLKADTTGLGLILVGRLLYFENIGSATEPNFDAPIANPFGADTSYYYSFPTIADLDDDGDYDVLVGEYYGNMEYYENIGTKESPEFAASIDLPFGIDHVYQLATPELADLDDDGDFDLLVSDYYGRFLYFENTGSASNPSFGSKQDDPFKMNDTLNSEYLCIQALADIDDDGDLDILSGSIGRALWYYEQGTVSGVQQFTKEDFVMFPNPTKNIINVNSNDIINKIEIIDLLGKTVITNTTSTKTINLTELTEGTYIAKVTFENGKIKTKRIIKN